MLNYDEESILKVLYSLYKEQNKQVVSGSFRDFPVKYQICYKEIISRLIEKKLITNFSDFIAGDFVLTLMPAGINYFGEECKEDFEDCIEDKSASENTEDKEIKTKQEQEKQGSHKSPDINDITITINIRLKELIKQAEQINENDKKTLLQILEDVKKITDYINLNHSVINYENSKDFVKKVLALNSKYPWLYNEIINILGTAVFKTFIN